MFHSGSGVGEIPRHSQRSSLRSRYQHGELAALPEFIHYGHESMEFKTERSRSFTTGVNLEVNWSVGATGWWFFEGAARRVGLAMIEQ